MGWHLFVSICLAIVVAVISAAFGVTAGMSALYGLIAFGVYWGVVTLWVNLDDLF